jgi:hypothetical protein
MIGEFLLKQKNIDTMLLIATVILAGAISAIMYAYLFRRKFNSAWNDSLDSLMVELSSSGTEIAYTLIEITMIAADKNSAMIMGMIKKEIQNNSESDVFFARLPLIIEEINDNNHTVVLNSDYAKARDSIKEAIELAKEYRCVSDFNDFSKLVVSVFWAKKNLKDAVESLKDVLYGLKSHSATDSV